MRRADDGTELKIGISPFRMERHKKSRKPRRYTPGRTGNPALSVTPSKAPEQGVCMNVKEMIAKMSKVGDTVYTIQDAAFTGVEKASMADIFELASVTADAASDIMRVTCMIDNEISKRIQKIDMKVEEPATASV